MARRKRSDDAYVDSGGSSDEGSSSGEEGELLGYRYRGTTALSAQDVEDLAGVVVSASSCADAARAQQDQDVAVLHEHRHAEGHTFALVQFALRTRAAGGDGNGGGGGGGGDGDGDGGSDGTVPPAPARTEYYRQWFKHPSAGRMGAWSPCGEAGSEVLPEVHRAAYADYRRRLCALRKSTLHKQWVYGNSPEKSTRDAAYYASVKEARKAARDTAAKAAKAAKAAAAAGRGVALPPGAVEEAEEIQVPKRGKKKPRRVPYCALCAQPVVLGETRLIDHTCNQKDSRHTMMQGTRHVAFCLHSTEGTTDVHQFMRQQPAVRPPPDAAPASEPAAAGFEPDPACSILWNLEHYLESSGTTADTHDLVNLVNNHPSYSAVLTPIGRHNQKHCNSGRHGSQGMNEDTSYRDRDNQLHRDGSTGSFVYALGMSMDEALGFDQDEHGADDLRSGQATVDGSIVGYSALENINSALYLAARSQHGVEGDDSFCGAPRSMAVKAIMAQTIFFDIGCAKAHAIVLAVAQGFSHATGIDCEPGDRAVCHNNLVHLHSINSQSHTRQNDVFKSARWFESLDWHGLCSPPSRTQIRRPLGIGSIIMCPHHQPNDEVGLGFRCTDPLCQNFQEQNTADVATYHGAEFNVFAIDEIDQFFKGRFAQNQCRRRPEGEALGALERQLKEKSKLFYLYLLGVQPKAQVKAAKLVGQTPKAIAMVWYTRSSNDPTRLQFTNSGEKKSARTYMPALVMLEALNAWTPIGTEWKVIMSNQWTQESNQTRAESRPCNDRNEDGCEDPIRSYIFWRVGVPQHEQEQAEEEQAEAEAEAEAEQEQEQGDFDFAAGVEFWNLAGIAPVSWQQDHDELLTM